MYFFRHLRSNAPASSHDRLNKEGSSIVLYKINIQYSEEGSSVYLALKIIKNDVKIIKMNM